MKIEGVMVVVATLDLKSNLLAENLPPTICCIVDGNVENKHSSKSWLLLSIVPVLAHTDTCYWHYAKLTYIWPVICDISNMPSISAGIKGAPQSQTTLFQVLFMLKT